MTRNHAPSSGPLSGLFAALAGLGPFDALRQRTSDLRARVTEAREQAKQAVREAGLTLPERPQPVIDVGDPPGRLRRLGNAAAAFALAVLVAGSLLAFASFFMQLLIATVLATRILGLKIDLGAFAKGAAP